MRLQQASISAGRLARWSGGPQPPCAARSTGLGPRGRTRRHLHWSPPRMSGLETSSSSRPAGNDGDKRRDRRANNGMATSSSAAEEPDAGALVDEVPCPAANGPDPSPQACKMQLHICQPPMSGGDGPPPSSPGIAGAGRPLRRLGGLGDEGEPPPAPALHAPQYVHAPLLCSG